jgi:hypothetical protein
MMFDYNLLGRGFRYSDFRNVRFNMSDEARVSFTTEYNRLYHEKHGHARSDEEDEERRIDEVAGLLFELLVALIEHENFPDWAEHAKNEAINGNLLLKAKQLLL